MKNFDYKKAKAELDDLLIWFQNSEVAIDEALVKYKRAEELLKQLEDYLKDTKIEIERLTKKTRKS
jgi:exonuclease VII small subunit